MISRPHHSARSPTWALDQVAWGLLAAVHVAPLWKTSAAVLIQGATGGHLAAWGAVLLSFAFFALKACAVPIPGLRLKRTTATVVLVCFALVHGETTVDLAQKYPEAAVLAVEPAAVLLARARRTLPEFLGGRAGTAGSPVLLHAFLGYRPVLDPVPARCASGAFCGAPRGPPRPAR